MPLPSVILHEASKASPPKAGKGKWAALIAPVEILLDRGFTLSQAVDWLISRDAVPARHRRTAYYSISQRLRRSGFLQQDKDGDAPTAPGTPGAEEAP